jgi:type 1 glutamine amidotransferase
MKNPVTVFVLFTLISGFGYAESAPAAVTLAKPKRAPIERPALRTRAEVDAILRQASPTPTELPPVKLLLVAGPKDHGVAQHDYPAWQKAWAPLLAKSPRVMVDTAFPWPTPEQFAATDVAIFYLHNPWNAEQLAQLEQFQRRGGGVVTIHWAIGADLLPLKFAERVGLAYPSARYREGPIDLQLVEHPITQGFPPVMRFTDEAYWPLVGDPARIHVLATSTERMDDGKDQPLPIFWTYEPAGGGRAFVCIFGHFMWTFDDPLFRLLLLRGVAWAGKQPVTRFDALATDGVAFRD